MMALHTIQDTVARTVHDDGLMIGDAKVVVGAREPRRIPADPRTDAIYVAIANAFIRESLQYAIGSRVTSRDVLGYRAEWCARHRLFRPPAQAVALAMRSSGYSLVKTGGRHVWCDVAWREQPEPFLTLAEPDVLRRITQSNPVMRLRVFLRLAGVGKSTFYRQVSTGMAPRFQKRGRLCFITVEDALAWCVSRSLHASVVAIMDWVEERRASVDATSRRKVDLLWTKAR